MSHLKARRRYLFFFWLGAVEAYTVFYPECSKPTSSYNFVANTDSRSTLDILWSSLLTVFACTWTIQHPNVPEQRDGRSPGWKGDLRWGLKGLWADIKLAIFTVIAPEVIITVATADLLVARRLCLDINTEFKDDNVPWTLSHSHFADMGGFIIRATSKTESNSISVSKPSHSNPYHLSALDILNLRRHGYINRLPSINEEDIRDRSKADPVLKAIAIVQILYSILQVTIRAFRGLAISLLELTVLAFAVCAVIIYALCWKKPKSVQSAITLLQYQDTIPPEVLGILDQELDDQSIVREYLFPSRFPSLRRERSRFPGAPFCNTGSKWDTIGPNWVVSVSAVAASTLFGAVHVAGWNFLFPSETEQIAWRVTSLYTAGFGAVTAVAHLVAYHLAYGVETASGLLEWWICGTS